MRKSLIAGNWKMFKTVPETEAFLKAFLPLVPEQSDREVLLCAPFIDLAAMKAGLQGNPFVTMGAQNVHWEKEGAYTGEISAAMLKSAGCTHVIIGHSERRTMFGETNETVRKKIEAAWSEQLHPVVCVGERLEEREAGKAQAVIAEELAEGLKGLDLSREALTIAYEPIWAIGTGKNATNEDAQEMAAFIRGELERLGGKEVAEKTRVLYGGSVKPATIDGLMRQPDIDGVLVGGASLKPEDFARIVRFEA